MIRLLEGTRDTEVTLRVGGDQIPPLVLMDHEFVVLGVLDGVVMPEDICLEQQKEFQFDWGC